MTTDNELNKEGKLSPEKIHNILTKLITESMTKLIPLDIEEVKQILEIEQDINVERKLKFEEISRHHIPDKYKDIQVNEEVFQTSAKKVKEFFEEIRENIFEAEHVIDCCILALLTQEHILIMGAPGNAKSMISDFIFARIIDEYTNKPSFFSYHITEVTVPDELLGPINWGALMKSGRLERDITQGILGANYALLDEVFDGNPGTLRACFNALNERLYRQGDKNFEGILESVIQTTNKYVSELKEINNQYGGYNSLDAYLDRLCFIAYMPEYFSKKINYFEMMKGNLIARLENKKHLLEKKLTCGELDIVQRATQLVKIPEEIIQFVIELIQELNKKLQSEEELRRNNSYFRTHYYSKRSFNKAINILQACVVYDKIFHNPNREFIASFNDVEMLHSCLILNGPEPKTIDKLLETKSFSGERERVQLEIIKKEQGHFINIYVNLLENFNNKINNEYISQNIEELKNKALELKNRSNANEIYDFIFQLTERLESTYYKKNQEQIKELIDNFIELYFKNNNDSEFSIFDVTLSDIDKRLYTLEKSEYVEKILQKYYPEKIQSIFPKNIRNNYITGTWNLLKQDLDLSFENNISLYNINYLKEENSKFMKRLEKIYNLSNNFSEEYSQDQKSSLKNHYYINLIEKFQYAFYNFFKNDLENVENLFSINSKLETYLLNLFEFLDTLDSKISESISEIIDKGLKNLIQKHLEKEKDTQIFVQLFNNFSKYKIEVPETAIACHNKVNSIIEGLLDQQKPTEKLTVYNQISKTNSESYIKYNNIFQNYLSQFQYNEYELLDSKLTGLCNNYLKKRYLNVLDNFDINSLKLELIENKVIFLRNWLKILISFSNENIKEINNLKDLELLTSKINSTDFTHLMYKPNYEYFKLTQEIEELRTKLNENQIGKLEKISVVLKSINDDFHLMISKFTNISKKLISINI